MSSLVWSGHGEAARRGRAGKNQSISVFLGAGLALKGACPVEAAADAGFSGAAAKVLGGDAPRAWAVERGNNSTSGRRTRSPSRGRSAKSAVKQIVVHDGFTAGSQMKSLAVASDMLQAGYRTMAQASCPETRRGRTKTFHVKQFCPIVMRHRTFLAGRSPDT